MALNIYRFKNNTWILTGISTATYAYALLSHAQYRETASYKRLEYKRSTNQNSPITNTEIIGIKYNKNTIIANSIGKIVVKIQLKPEHIASWSDHDRIGLMVYLEAQLCDFEEITDERAYHISKIDDSFKEVISRHQWSDDQEEDQQKNDDQ